MQSPTLKTSRMQRSIHSFQSKQVLQPCHNPWQTRKITPSHLTSKPWIPAELINTVPRDATSYSLGIREAGPSGPADAPTTPMCSQGHPTLQCQTGLSAKPCLPGTPPPRSQNFLPHRCPPSPATAPRGALSTKTMEAPSGTHHFEEAFED